MKPGMALRWLLFLGFLGLQVSSVFCYASFFLGTAGNSFECEDLRFVRPRINPLSRRVKNGACGGQHVLHRSEIYDTLEDALEGVCGKWVQGIEF